MSRTVIRSPEGAGTPEWEQLPPEDGFMVFKIQALPSELQPLTHNQTVLQLGTQKTYFIRKAKRLPGPPTQPPKQPYKVWCERVN